MTHFMIMLVIVAARMFLGVNVETDAIYHTQEMQEFESTDNATGQS